MCGIWGWWYRDGKPAANEDVVRQVTNVMQVRGPDDFGCYRSPAGMAMGFRRLSIIDLGSGHQPMSNEDGTVQVTLNGEIYNFKTLRERLLGLGHTFQTHSDTEVIAHGYEQWGDEVICQLCGMFGISIWDEKRRRLLVARDRMGIKPVYYVDTRESFGYASDPRALIDMADVDSGFNDEALALYLHYGYIPAPWSIYRGVRKLRPAEMCIVESGRTRLKRYWNISFRPEKRSPEACLSQFETLFEEVVGEHLVSDVPLGAFLSGGMDSTCVVQAATQMATKPIKTFNIAFSAPDSNEERWAVQAATELRTDHHRLALEEDAYEHVAETLSSFPEPFGDSAATPNRVLSERIREHCTVALSGDGGDEVFGGYGLRTAQAVTYLRRFPASFRRLASYVPGIRTVARKSLHDLPNFYAACRARLSIDQVERIMDPGCKPREAIESQIAMMRDDLRNSNAQGLINPFLFLDQSFGLADQMLTKVDVTSMAHSLEVRVPMLDHRIVEFAAALPEEMKQKGFGKDSTKMIIRHYLRRRFPDSFINRPKRGFGMPVVSSARATVEKRVREELGKSTSVSLPCVRLEATRALLNSSQLSPNGLWVLYTLFLWNKNIPKRATER